VSLRLWMGGNKADCSLLPCCCTSKAVGRHARGAPATGRTNQTPPRPPIALPQHAPRQLCRRRWLLGRRQTCQAGWCLRCEVGRAVRWWQGYDARSAKQFPLLSSLFSRRKVKKKSGAHTVLTKGHKGEASHRGRERHLAAKQLCHLTEGGHRGQARMRG